MNSEEFPMEFHLTDENLQYFAKWAEKRNRPIDWSVFDKCLAFIKENGYIDEEFTLYQEEKSPITTEEYNALFTALQRYAEKSVIYDPDSDFPHNQIFFVFENQKFVWDLLIGQGSSCSLIIPREDYTFNDEYAVYIRRGEDKHKYWGYNIRSYFDFDRKGIIELLTETKNFSAEEIDIAIELLNDHEYELRIIDYENELAGFIVYSETPATEGSYDLYWLAVHPKFHGKGIAQQLSNFLDKKVKENDGYLIRAETSGRESYDRTRKFYQKEKYQQVGLIKDFYKPGEDLVTFAKDLRSLKTGAQWQKHYPHFDVLDADGWNPRSNFDEQYITRKEFESKVCRCTCMWSGKVDSSHWFDFVENPE